MNDKAVLVLSGDKKTRPGQRQDRGLKLEAALTCGIGQLGITPKELPLLPDQAAAPSADEIIARSDVHPPCEMTDKYKVDHVMMRC